MDYYINNCHVTIQTYKSIGSRNQFWNSTIDHVIACIKRKINRYGLPPKKITIGRKENATSTQITEEHFNILKQEFPQLVNF